MKTKLEIEARLKNLRIDLKEANRRFNRYDLHDDMEQCEELEIKVQMLEWVLGYN